MERRLKRTFHLAIALVGAALIALPRVHVAPVIAQSRPQPAPARPPAVKTTRLYVFDMGRLPVPDPKSYGFTKDEIPAVPLAVAAYLIVNPKGTLQWETGLVPDEEVGTPARNSERAQGHKLRDEMARVGYRPEDVTYLALSHYHSDHTGNANQFTESTWLVRKAERDLMFGDQPQRVMVPRLFTALKDVKTIYIDKDDYDVFGDQTVVIKATPGHTIGHQVLVLKLAKTGTIVLAGDLYHFPEERNSDKFPTWEYNVDRARVSRAMVEDFLKKTKAQLWIEHDVRNHEKLKKAPEYYE
jgi:N-acyl homoserine lactone hydrolase